MLGRLTYSNIISSSIYTIFGSIFRFPNSTRNIFEYYLHNKTREKKIKYNQLKFGVNEGIFLQFLLYYFIDCFLTQKCSYSGELCYVVSCTYNIASGKVCTNVGCWLLPLPQIWRVVLWISTLSECIRGTCKKKIAKFCEKKKSNLTFFCAHKPIICLG